MISCEGRPVCDQGNQCIVSKMIEVGASFVIVQNFIFEGSSIEKHSLGQISSITYYD